MIRTAVVPKEALPAGSKTSSTPAETASTIYVNNTRYSSMTLRLSRQAPLLDDAHNCVCVCVCVIADGIQSRCVVASLLYELRVRAPIAFVTRVAGTT